MNRRGLRLITLALAATLAGLSMSAAPAAADDLIPLPAPGQPVASEITSTSAVLTWPRSDGPVFRYSLKQLVDGEWQGYASAPGTSITLAALTPDTEYTFAVFAAAMPYSGYTTSPLSEPVTFRTLPVDWSCQIGIIPMNGIFTASATVFNAPWSWRLTFTLAADQTVTQVWNATYSQSGSQGFLSGGTWSNPVPTPGGSINFGFVGQYTGTFVPPEDFRLNGVPCDVSIGPW